MSDEYSAGSSTSRPPIDQHTNTGGNARPTDGPGRRFAGAGSVDRPSKEILCAPRGDCLLMPLNPDSASGDEALELEAELLAKCE